MNPDDVQKLRFEEELRRIKEATLFKFLSKQARERLSNIRAVRQELAERIELTILSLIERGVIKDELSDEVLKKLIMEIQKSEKKEFRIIK